MKMFTFEAIVGGFLIILGVAIIIKVVFGIEIPIIRLALAAFFIYLGFTLVTGVKPFKFDTFHHVAFEQRTITPNKAEGEYSVLFGKGVIDLTHLKNNGKKNHAIIKAQFGEAVVKISKEIPTKIVARASFGLATFPDGTEISAGSYTYQNYEDPQETILEVEASVSFGSLRIIQV